MAKTRQQKEDILERLTSIFKDSASTVFVHFKGLTVGNEMTMRHTLEEDGVGYFVAKKTLMRKAAEQAGITGDVPELEGEIAVAHSSFGNGDPTAPARGIHSFVQKYEGSLAIVGGIYEGGMLAAAKMQEIATIPPLDVLRGMFANVINSPLQGLAVALGQVAEKKA